MHAFVLADPSRCIGCRACEIACAEVHMQAAMAQAMAQGLPFVTRICVIRAAGVSAPIQCRQCEDAPCATACPTGAVTSDGRAIVVDADKCCACKACLAVCPVGAMQIAATPGQDKPVACKCDLCIGSADRPACVSVCPAAALRVFSREELQRRTCARRRQSALQLAANTSEGTR